MTNIDLNILSTRTCALRLSMLTIMCECSITIRWPLKREKQLQHQKSDETVHIFEIIKFYYSYYLNFHSLQWQPWENLMRSLIFVRWCYHSVISVLLESVFLLLVLKIILKIISFMNYREDQIINETYSSFTFLRKIEP